MRDDPLVRRSEGGGPASPSTELPPPPGPRGLPVVGSLLQLARSPEPPHIAITHLAREYGGVVAFRVGEVPTVVFADPELMVEAFEKTELADRWVLQVHATLHGAMVFSQYDDSWRRMHQVAVSRLWSAEQVAALSENHFEPAFDAVADRICLMADSGQPVDVPGVMLDACSDMIFRAFFGREEVESDEMRTGREQFREHAVWFQSAGSVPMPGDLFRWAKFIPSGTLKKGHRLREVQDAMFARLLQSARRRRADNAPAVPGLVDILLDMEEAEGIDHSTVYGIYLDTLVSGPLQAAPVVWFLLLVANRPEVQAIIHEEMDRVMGPEGRPPCMDDHARLPYIFACVAELLRYRPLNPLGLPHRAAQDTEIGGYRIRKGTQVLGSVYGASRDERYWDAPDDFIPERFMPQDDGSPSPALTSVAYMPFGTGIRHCSGDRFAQTVIWVAVTRILQRLRFETPEGLPLSEEQVHRSFVQPRPFTLKALRRSR